jgi:hypothetical protein
MARLRERRGEKPKPAPKPKAPPPSEPRDEVVHPEDQPDPLALNVPINLDQALWMGTTFADRVTHATSTLSRDLLASVERSLLAQENYDDFTDRLYRELGINTEEPSGALRDLETRVTAEARRAWNQGLIAGNQTEQTVLTWRSRLLPTTTAGCAARHGKTLDEIDGQLPPSHWNCYCDLESVDDPDSTDPDIAAAGQARLDEMAAEREAWGASDADLFEESARRPSRFAAFRELGGPLPDVALHAPETTVALSRFASFREVSATGPQPTLAQITAGNYPKRKVHLHGFGISIENEAGSTRSGFTADGTPWSRVLPYAYGYICRSTGEDGEQTDCFLGPHLDSPLVFVITQHASSGALDEFKVIFGARTATEAEGIYRSAYPQDWPRFGGIRGFTVDEFARWLRKVQPVRESRPSRFAAFREIAQQCA